jgi:hypothetical protein
MNLESAIQEVLRQEIEKEVAEAVKEAKARLERRIPEIVAGVALHVQKRLSIDRLQDEIVIHVKLSGALP